MQIRLLKKHYLDSDGIFDDFKNNKVNSPENFSIEVVEIDDITFFPIYMANKDGINWKQDYRVAFHTMIDKYMNVPREILMNESFWRTLLLVHFRDEIITKYPQVIEHESKFRNIIMKKFDWENYIYKVVLASQYVYDNADTVKFDSYFDTILDNLDLYNYMIKYNIFKNGTFIIRILDIVNELNISSILKAKIKDREDLGDDERYGRRVIFEFNKDYPVVMSPLMDYDKLKVMFIENLKKYKPDFIQNI